VAGSPCTRIDWVAPRLLGESTRRPEMNSPARPRGGFYDNIMRLHFNASWRKVTYEWTSQQSSIVTLISFPVFAPPLVSIKGRGGQPSQGLADEPNTRSGLGHDTLSRPLLQTTLEREHDSSTLDAGYYSSKARTSINLVVSCANDLSPTHDR
jgi:hypothetical protein